MPDRVSRKMIDDSVFDVRSFYDDVPRLCLTTAIIDDMQKMFMSFDSFSKSALSLFEAQRACRMQKAPVYVR